MLAFGDSPLFGTVLLGVVEWHKGLQYMHQMKPGWRMTTELTLL